MAFLSWLKGLIPTPENRNALQKAAVNGDNNTINQTAVSQTFFISPDLTKDSLFELFEKGTRFSEGNPPVGSNISDRGSPEDTSEVKLIIALRQIGIDGNNSAALKSLTALLEKSEYASGYNAFRLKFNIGMVLHNMGRTDEAIKRLKEAFEQCSEDPKARTGYAFSLLLEHKDAEALSVALETIKIEGDHRSLATIIIYLASTHLGRILGEFDLPESLEPSEEVEAARLEYLEYQNKDKFVEELEASISKGNAPEHVKERWALHVLSDMRGNQAYLLGRRFPDEFEQRVSKAASVLSKQLEQALEQIPPNPLLLPIQANNAAVALRLIGKVEKASRLIEKCIERFPEMASAMAYPRAILFLEQDREVDALMTINSIDNAQIEL
jgi:tetratricopeptide (TPR) repeat protein